MKQRTLSLVVALALVAALSSCSTVRSLIAPQPTPTAAANTVRGQVDEFALLRLRIMERMAGGDAR